MSKHYTQKNIMYSRPLFQELSRNRRRKIVINSKNRIRLAKAMHGNEFHTDNVICEECRNSWASFVFLSKKDMFSIYIAFIELAQKKMVDDAFSLMINRSYGIVPYNDDDEMNFIPAEIDAWGRVKTYTAEWGKQNYPEFDGLTRSEWEHRELDKYLKNEKPHVFESYELKYDLSYGIGLHMVVNAPQITPAVINEHILRFREMGECNWKAETPVPESHLVYSADWYRECNLSMGNALTEEASNRLNRKIMTDG